MWPVCGVQGVLTKLEHPTSLQLQRYWDGWCLHVSVLGWALNVHVFASRFKQKPKNERANDSSA